MRNIYLLNNQQFEGIKNLEVFKIEYLKTSVDFDKYEALIFTSKNAVYSLKNFSNKWKKISSYAIASKTANTIAQEGGKVNFIANSSNGNDFAKKLIPLLKNKKALYIRAEKVVSNLVQILKENNIDILELITYKTVCNTSLNSKLEKNSIFIFTSPSSVSCFFENYSWEDSFYAIAIGKTTAKALPNYVKYSISKQTSIEECIKLAKMVTF